MSNGGIGVGHHAWCSPLLLLDPARRVTSDGAAGLKRFLDSNPGNLADDRHGSPPLMAKSGRELRYGAEHWPNISFSPTRERLR